MRYFEQLNYPAVLNDEFGYWANAVSIAGYDWKSLIAETPYYSYGYSLLLVPIVLFVSAEYWYKAGILLNIIMLCFSYILCYKFSKKLFPQCKDSVLQLISLIVVLFPCNVVYAQQTWSETLLYLLMWLTTKQMLKLEEKFSWKDFTILNLLVAYMYVVHARTIVIIALTLFFETIILWRQKINISYILIGIFIFGSIYFVSGGIKEVIVSQFYSNSSASEINNVGLNSGTIMIYFNRLFEFGIQIIQSFGYKFIHIIIASGMTILVGIYGIGRRFIKEVYKKTYSRGIITQVWCMLALAGELVICALQMYSFMSRKDIIVYSRYYDNAMGPLLLIALVYTYLNIKENRWMIFIEEILLILFVPKIVTIILNADSFFNSICSPIIGGFWDNIEDKNQLCGIILAIMFLISTVFLFINFMNKNRKSSIFILIGIGIFFLIMGEKGSGYVLGHRKKVDQTILGIEKIIEENYVEQEILYIKYEKADQYSVWPKYLQFLIPDNEIKVVDNLANDSEKLVLINNADKESKSKLETEQYILLCQGKQMSLYGNN